MNEVSNPYSAPEATRTVGAHPPRLRRPEEFSTPFRLFLWLMIGGVAALVIGIAIIIASVGTAAMASAKEAQGDARSQQTAEQRREGEQRRQAEMQERVQENVVPMMAGGLLYAAGGGALVAAAVFQLILIYRAWEIIQDGRARTSPGRAVGFLFIPLFNFYWFFVAKFGLAKDLNAYVERHGIVARQASPALGLTCAILMVCSVIPLVMLFAIVPAFVVLAVFLK
ncbi:MAG: twin-arginine translocase TatA/TatE family subunit, partial [Planctomycetes bacterium]|nr:twin-arginine translocase TatA/TatE family subunit [Planctomycetota bacterium]